jgi:hypothetical protein
MVIAADMNRDSVVTALDAPMILHVAMWQSRSTKKVGLGLPLPHFMLDSAAIFDYFKIFRVIPIVTSIYRPAYKINGLQTRVLM